MYSLKRGKNVVKTLTNYEFDIGRPDATKLHFSALAILEVVEVF